MCVFCVERFLSIAVDLCSSGKVVSNHTDEDDDDDDDGDGDDVDGNEDNSNKGT